VKSITGVLRYTGGTRHTAPPLIFTGMTLYTSYLHPLQDRRCESTGSLRRICCLVSKHNLSFGEAITKQRLNK
jgi:hypothetical protein